MRSCLSIHFFRISAFIVTAVTVMLLGSAAHAATYTVNVGPDNTYSPAQLTVSPGDTVVWEWTGLMPHNVVSGTGPTDPNMGVEFDSGIPVAAPKTFTHTFNSIGTFDYFCTPHVMFLMTGVIDVVSGGIAVPSMDTWALLFAVLLIGMLGLFWSGRFSKA